MKLREAERWFRGWSRGRLGTHKLSYEITVNREFYNQSQKYAFTIYEAVCSVCKIRLSIVPFNYFPFCSKEWSPAQVRKFMMESLFEVNQRTCQENIDLDICQNIIEH